MTEDFWRADVMSWVEDASPDPDRHDLLPATIIRSEPMGSRCQECDGLCGWCGNPRDNLPDECRMFGDRSIINEGHEPCPDCTPENVEEPTVTDRAVRAER